jgi:hypothetical protein
MDLTKQEKYRQKLRAKASIFDRFQDCRRRVIRKDIASLVAAGPVEPEVRLLFPYYLNFPAFDRIVVPVRTAPAGAKRHVWVAQGSRAQMLLLAHAFDKLTQDDFEFTHPQHVFTRQYKSPLDTHYSVVAHQEEQLMRDLDFWVTA